MGQSSSAQTRGLRILSFHQSLFDKTLNQYFAHHIRWQVQRQAPNAGKGLGSEVCTIQELLGYADLNNDDNLRTCGKQGVLREKSPADIL